MALFALAVVLVLMQQIRKNLMMVPHSPSSKIQIGIIDSTYYCAPYKFSLTLPNHNWRLSRLADTLTAVPADTTLQLWSQILWLVQFQRLETDTMAQGRIGVLDWPSYVSHDDLAIELMAEHIQRMETNNRRVTILQPVTSPAHPSFPGSYFVMIIPPPDSRMLVCCVLVRKNWAYIIECTAAEDDYDVLRGEIQKLVRGFRSFAAV